MKQFLLFVLAAFVVIAVVLIVAAGGFENFWFFVSTADALVVVSLAALGLVIASFGAGIATKDNSWVDRLWSTAPVFFVWYYAARGAFSPSLLVIALIVTVWGIRLTANFARKGGYNGEEDYRWAVLRGRITNPLLWQLFHFFFICGFQIGMFVLFTIPAYLVVIHPVSFNDPFFILFGILAIACIVLESTADDQQWKFHQVKSEFKAGKNISASALAADVKRGFLSSGLFGVSRHPNYFGEIAHWWMLYFAVTVASGTVLQLAVIGPVALALLFVGSTIFTEEISSSKYPDYAVYKRRVSAIVPWFPAKLKDDSEAATG